MSSEYRCVCQMHLISWEAWMQMWLASLMRLCPSVLEKAARTNATFSAREGTNVFRSQLNQCIGRNLEASWNSLIVSSRLPRTAKTGGTWHVEPQMLLFFPLPLPLHPFLLLLFNM